MTTTPTTPPAPLPPAERVKELLGENKTVQAVAELTGWPRNQILAVVNGVAGWLHDPTTDRITQFTKKAATPPPSAHFQPPATPARTPGGVAPSQLPVTAIDPHPGNLRAQLGDLTELADSIRAHGILQPLIVAPHPSRDGGYQLLGGHRRMAAAQLAGLTAVPVVMHAPADAAQAIEVMLIENCHREGLTPLEKAEAFGKLLRLGLSQAEVAKRTGFHFSTVSSTLTLLDLDAASQERVRRGELTVGDAVAAVRKTRAKKRKSEGRHHDFTWEPEYLTDSHPLAKKAASYCEAREHTMRRRIGRVACGQCWETAIRADEQVVAKASYNLGEGGHA